MRLTTIIAFFSLAVAGCAGPTPMEPTPETPPVPIIVEVEATHTLPGYVRIDWWVRGGQGLDLRSAAPPRRATVEASRNALAGWNRPNDD